MGVVDKIVKYEWEMLLKTNSQQQHLECKNNKYMFFLMRKSQWSVYPLDIQAAYLRDIHQAIATGRNLMIEKYAYMMEHTDPSSFAQLKDRLPFRGEQKRALVKDILEQHQHWYAEVVLQLPKTVAQGRGCTVNSTQLTDVPTYLEGELYTYSEDTLERIFAFNQAEKQRGNNVLFCIYQNYMALK